MPKTVNRLTRKTPTGDTMMPTKLSGRRAARSRPGRRRWLPVIIGLIVGLVGGAALAGSYPPPSTDMLKVQATSWYQHMRQLLVPRDSAATRTWVGCPQVYADPPITWPPDPAAHAALL